MTGIVMRMDVDTEPSKVVSALATHAGITGWWTTQAEVPTVAGKTMMLEFPVAPKPFDLRVNEVSERRVAWHPLTFPPHWVGTEISWDLSESPEGPGTRVLFRHDDWQDEDQMAHAAFIWAQLLVRLKDYVETGQRQPLFGGE